MIGKFSINILLQSFNQADETPRDSFENKIVLYNFEEEINNKVNEAIKQGLEICKDF